MNTNHKSYLTEMPVSDAGGSTPGGEDGQSEVVLETLEPFDTILVRTLNSEYRIVVLDPKTGRSRVEGGHYLIEGREAIVAGSYRALDFKLGSIGVGYHVEMLVDDRIVTTSRVQSITVGHRDDVESVEVFSTVIH